MEGGADPKKMARSKRASSQRSKSKHSRHARGGGVPSGVREKNVAEESLPSNWERYESSSDEDATHIAEGEVRPKSKGADYSELLSSDTPKLFEDPPEPEGMMAMLLANGLGLWDFDSSYLQPASSAAERQAARDASALLTVDLGLLGKSLSCLKLAQRLCVEDDLFPEQHHDSWKVADIERRVIHSDDGAAVKEGSAHEDHKISRDSIIHPQQDDFSPSASGRGANSGKLDWESVAGIEPDKVIGVNTFLSSSGQTNSSSSNHDDSIANSSSTADTHFEQQTSITREMMQRERANDVYGSNTFEATGAVAELDDLLDMLDKQHVGILLNKNKYNQDPITSSSTTSDFLLSTYSKTSNSGIQESVEQSERRKIATKSEVVSPSQDRGLVSTGIKTLEERASSNDAKVTAVLLSQDEDFDSWLDSI